MATTIEKGKASLHSMDAVNAARVAMKVEAEQNHTKLTTRQMIGELAPEISDLRQKNYSAEAILKILTAAGLNLSLATLCRYLDKKNRIRKPKTEKQILTPNEKSQQCETVFDTIAAFRAAKEQLNK